MARILLAIGLTILMTINCAEACTNLLVSKGASADGSTMITYNADAGGFMERLYFSPAAEHGPNDSLEVYEWDTGKYLGKIKQVPKTLQVVGNMNEKQVSIGETTFTGRKELKDSTGIIDYGSLMFITLQRAKTAREAIKIMTDLVAEYGYYSTGESFSVADPNEVWILEMIGKGPGNTGALWAARKVPDGYVCAHANQARIREVPRNDKENCLYNPEIFEFAKEKGWYKPDSADFSFADIYCPLDPGGVLYCEGRVWSLFRRCAPSLNLSPDYYRAVKGAEPYPLFIKPDKKVSVQDVISLMRDHFEGTDYDMTKGIAAGPYGCPYRWKPLQWKVEGDTVTNYGWGRPISTQQTAFAFVSQMRSQYPDPIGGVFWYGVDDNYSNVYIPLYCCMNRVPKAFNTGSIKDFTLESAFWVFNLVANIAYTKYSFVIEDIQKVQKEIEDRFHHNQEYIDKTALAIMKNDSAEAAIEFLSDYSVSQSEITTDRWRDLWKYIVVKYNDGYINDVEVENGRHPKSSGYGEDFKKSVIKERPGFYEVKWRNKKGE